VNQSLTTRARRLLEDAWEQAYSHDDDDGGSATLAARELLDAYEALSLLPADELAEWGSRMARLEPRPTLRDRAPKAALRAADHLGRLSEQAGSSERDLNRLGSAIWLYKGLGLLSADQLDIWFDRYEEVEIAFEPPAPEIPEAFEPADLRLTGGAAAGPGALAITAAEGTPDEVVVHWALRPTGEEIEDAGGLVQMSIDLDLPTLSDDAGNRWEPGNASVTWCGSVALGMSRFRLPPRPGTTITLQLGERSASLACESP
jgi:hypothetical protein